MDHTSAWKASYNSGHLWLAIGVLVVGISMGRFVTGPLTGDDDYVLHNLASTNISEVLFAYNVDLVRGVGGETTWYDGYDTVQRRYVRAIPSALMAIEYRLFGSNPVALKTVSLLLHLLVVILGFHLLCRVSNDPQSTAIVVTVFGLHPASAEIIGWFACQPILIAGIFSMLATEALLRLREKVTPFLCVLFATTSIATLFTYEAAIALPLLLVGFDWYWPGNGARRPTNWVASLAVLAAYPFYIAIWIWNQRGVTLSDASYRAGFIESLENIRIDLANYLVKIIPMPPYGSEAYGAIGSWLGAIILLVVVAFWLLRIRRSKILLIGVLVFAALLAPPLLTRAVVSVLNFPSFRQLYLPLFGIAILLCAWRPCGFTRTGLWVSRMLVILLLGLYQIMGPALVDADARVAQRDGGLRLQELLISSDTAMPIIQIGQSDCGYSLLYDSKGHEVWKLIPPTTSGGLPLLRTLDDRTMEILPPEGEVLAILTSPPQELDPRRSRNMPPLVTYGTQEFDIATAYGLPGVSGAEYGFQIRFNQPLINYLFVSISGCAEIELLSL